MEKFKSHAGSFWLPIIINIGLSYLPQKSTINSVSTNVIFCNLAINSVRSNCCMKKPMGVLVNTLAQLMHPLYKEKMFPIFEGKC